MHQRFENKFVTNLGEKNTNLGTILYQNLQKITNVFTATNEQ